MYAFFWCHFDMFALNTRLFLLLNAGRPANGLVMTLADALAVYAVFLLPLALVVLWLMGNWSDRWLAVSALIGCLAALSLNDIIGNFAFVPRPAQLGIGNSYLSHVPDSSFPSDHATVIFAAMWAYTIGGRRGLAIAFGTLAIVIGWARIYMGVHFPIDIAGAALTGLVGSCLSHVVMKAGGRRLLDFAQPIYRRLFAFMVNRGWVKP